MNLSTGHIADRPKTEKGSGNWDRQASKGWKRSCRYLSGITMALLLAGCGSPTGPELGTVTGIVTLNGKPLSNANVTFVPTESGSPSYGGTDEDGVYHLMFNQHRAGAEIGRHHVLVELREPETDDSGNLVEVRPQTKVPDRYRQSGTLTAEVEQGDNELDFDLSSN